MKKKDLKKEIDNLQSQISLLSTEVGFLQGFCRFLDEGKYAEFLMRTNQYRPINPINPGEKYVQE